MKYTEVIEVLIQFTLYTGVPGIVYFLFSRKGSTSISGTIFFILLASFSADFAAFMYSKYIYPNSYGIGNVWHLINYGLVSWLFYQIIPSKKKFILTLFGVFFLSSVISFFYYSFWDANPLIRVLSNIFFIILSILAYLEMLKAPGQGLKNNPVFWAITAIFIYSSVTLLRNLFTQYLVFDLEVTKDVFSTITLIYLIANSSKNFILFYSLILIDKGFQETKNG